MILGQHLFFPLKGGLWLYFLLHFLCGDDNHANDACSSQLGKQWRPLSLVPALRLSIGTSHV